MQDFFHPQYQRKIQWLCAKPGIYRQHMLMGKMMIGLRMERSAGAGVMYPPDAPLVGPHPRVTPLPRCKIIFLLETATMLAWVQNNSHWNSREMMEIVIKSAIVFHFLWKSGVLESLRRSSMSDIPLIGFTWFLCWWILNPVADISSIIMMFLGCC